MNYGVFDLNPPGLVIERLRVTRRVRYILAAEFFKRVYSSPFPFSPLPGSHST
jgi:hypothetical protein